ncbi:MULTISPECIES: hypothetical protein [Leptospira]|uniref:hypothetical protein n=1 Tax=Leptospira TaxID=171 RepID=UPI0007787CF2|nr:MULTISPECIES: hypothetical protein [Leptospira]KXZ28507.1 hypothetical protein AYB32_00900 [Leptospira kirschneri]KXZ31277.1 hypothetical protein AYB34_02230 [Leptospira sp. ZV016]
MIVLQNINLQWNKLMRGAPYSTLRNRLDKSYQLPEIMFHYNKNIGIPYHDVRILQTKDGFKTILNECRYFESQNMNWKIGCTEIIKEDSKYTLYFLYSKNCGYPIRYGKTFGFLHEKALDIFSNEFGRILYNGRHTDSDTGEWFYSLNILNVCETEEKNCNLFLKESDKKYEQLGILY